MAESGYYSGYQDDVDVDEQKRHQALYLIGNYSVGYGMYYCVNGVCIMLACYVPGFLKKTLDAWLNSSSLMKRRVASTLTRTPFDSTGPERERNWDARRQSANTNPVNQPNTGSVF
uniref:Movement protein n=1 Tax=Faba bean necrotic yellows virus TaxID=59817 RepID=A0A6C0FMH3_9VIRU|nr:movement protein [Faba bean necrotic yellows virus]